MSSSSTTVLPVLPAAELETLLRGRNMLIVGGTAGIGKALALACMSRGANVTVVGRRDPGPELAKAKFVPKDLSLMKNAAALADDVDVTVLDTVVFTTGIIAFPERKETEEHVEIDMAVSYLSRLVFMRKVMDKGFGSKRSDMAHKPRIFVMGYPGKDSVAALDDFNSEKSYSAMAAHVNAVVGNEALVAYLGAEFKGAVNVYGLNPGLIKTEIRDNLLGKGSWKSWIVEGLIGMFTPTAATYVERSLIHVVASPQLEQMPGALIDPSRKMLRLSAFLQKEGNHDRVIAESLKLADKALGVTVGAPAAPAATSAS